MYYSSSKRNDLKKWLSGRNSKLYAIMLCILGVIIFFVFQNIDNIGNYNAGNDTSSTTSDSIEESSATFVAENESYLIRINKTQNFLTIYKVNSTKENKTVYKTVRCSVNSTIQTGITEISEKYIWRKINNNVYGQYTSRVGDIGYIHSVPYSSENNSSVIASAYNLLGSTAQIGSIYLASSDAKWIYENCANKTTVEVYEDENEQPAIALEEFATIPNGASYDPSDTQNSKNIVAAKIKYMSGVNDCSIELNSSFNMWEGIYAVDEQSNDITSYISITGTVNTAVAGQYTLVYNLQDAMGTVLAYYRYVTVY